MLIILHFHITELYILPLASWAFSASRSADVELGLEMDADQWEAGGWAPEGRGSKCARVGQSSVPYCR